MRFNSSLFSGIAIFFFLFLSTGVIGAQTTLTGIDQVARETAVKCREDVVAELNKLLDSNILSLAQLFDTFYIPIPDTNPPKYHTQYDRYTDKVLRIILDDYLKQKPWFLYVVAVDRNGYLPTHNSKYSRPLTNNDDYNIKHNRTKRIYNDQTGLAAARNTKPYLLKTYERDTGETISDLSVPIYIQGKHWGAIRVGYRRN